MGRIQDRANLYENPRFSAWDFRLFCVCVLFLRFCLEYAIKLKNLVVKHEDTYTYFFLLTIDN